MTTSTPTHDLVIRGGLIVDGTGRRFANDSRIVCAVGAEEGLARLRKLAGRADPVALLIADQRMPGLTGVEFQQVPHLFFLCAQIYLGRIHRGRLTRHALHHPDARALHGRQIASPPGP